MLSHSEKASGGAGGQESLRCERAWSAIEVSLHDRQLATVMEIAQDIGMTEGATRHRLYELQEMGIARVVPKRQGQRQYRWELGTEAAIARADAMKPTIIKAQQIGIVNSDPLIVALFGRGALRCVGCQQPQGAPHSDGCTFTGINIDAAHQPAAGANAQQFSVGA